MTAALWLFLSVFAGWQIIRFAVDTSGWITGLGSLATATPFCRAPWTIWLLRLAMSISIGLLSVTWLTYGLATWLHFYLPDGWHPLLPANLLVMSGLAVWVCFAAYRKRQSLLAGWPGRMRALQRGSAGIALLTALLWLLFAGWLMFSTFYRSGSYIHAGFSVFSDFAPHTAMVSSFSSGRNWPTQYPHFANDGIAYHFIFFFLCSNLHYLGLPLDWAINLPSLLTFFSFCILLGFLAVRLTGRTATFLLAPLMLFLRSSLAFFTHLSHMTERFVRPRAWGALLRTLWQQAAFIGNTPRDEWGLWGINVYANQRHLLSGLALMLVVLLLVLPDLQTGLRSGSKSWIRSEGWLPLTAAARKRYAVALLICLLMPYWHGSALVSLLLVVMPIALFSLNRLGILLLAIASVVSAMLQSWLFSGQATRVVQPAFFFGFIAADHSVGGILYYLLMVTGLALPLLFIAFWLPGWRRKVLLMSFMMPLAFAFTISLTPDVTVNHKYIIISLALANIYLADLLVRLWQKNHRQTLPEGNNPAVTLNRLPVPFWLRRMTALLLALMLMVTGLYEIRIVRNINQNTVVLDTQSALVAWIRENTQPDAIFVSAPYHYNTFFLSGRAIWFGHSYYAWSAGHDTSRRFDQLRFFLAAADEDLTAVRGMIQEERLHYLLVDDTLRNNHDLPVNESFFQHFFPLAASFPEQGNTLIYALKYIPDA